MANAWWDAIHPHGMWAYAPKRDTDNVMDAMQDKWVCTTVEGKEELQIVNIYDQTCE